MKKSFFSISKKIKSKRNWVTKQVQKAGYSYTKRTHNIQTPLLNRFLVEGKHFFKNGDYDKASFEFNQKLQLEPTSGEALLGRGKCHLKTRNYEKAIEDFSEILTYLSQERYHVLARYYRGVCLIETGEDVEALKDFTYVIEKYKHSSPKLVNRILLRKEVILKTYKGILENDFRIEKNVSSENLIFEENYFLNEKEFGKGSSIVNYHTYTHNYGSKNPDTMDALKWINEDGKWNKRNRLGRIGENENEDEFIISLSYHYRSRIYLNLGKWELSARDSYKAILFDNFFFDAYQTLSFLEFYFQRWDRAIEILDEGIRLNSDQDSLYFLRGSIYNLRDEKEKSVADYSSAIERNPLYDNSYKNRALIYQETKNYHLAVKDLDFYLGLNPYDFDAHYSMACCLKYLKQYLKALDHLNLILHNKELLKHMNEKEVANYYLKRAELYELSGDKKSAIKDKRTAVEIFFKSVIKKKEI